MGALAKVAKPGSCVCIWGKKKPQGSQPWKPIPSGEGDQGYCRYLIGEGILASPRIDDSQMVQIQIRQGRFDRWGELGCIYAFTFDANASAVFHEEQIEFCTRMGGPKIGLVRFERGQDFFHGIALPGRTALGMMFQLQGRVNAQEMVQESRIPEEELGSLHLPLADIRVPGLEDAKEEGACQQLQIASNRGFAHAQGASWFGSIPNLSVVVGQHAPETEKGLGR